MKNDLKELINFRRASRVTRLASTQARYAFSFVLCLIMSLTHLFAADVWAMSAPEGQEGKGSGGGFALFMPMILVFLIFYFLLIRPQAKQQRKHQSLLKELKRGDLIITSSGIHGKIISVTDTTVGVEIAENIRIKMEKKQVSQIITPQVATEKKS